MIGNKGADGDNSWTSCRERQRNGRALYRIECDEIEVEEMLAAAGLIRAVDPSKQDLERALAEWVSLSIAACCNADNADVLKSDSQIVIRLNKARPDVP